MDVAGIFLTKLVAVVLAFVFAGGVMTGIYFAETFGR